MAVVVTAFTVVMAASLIFTSTTSFCDACHLHPADIAAYKVSAHKGVNCEQCHSKPGPFFFLTAKLEALQEPIKFYLGNYEKPILGSVSNQACRRCHTNETLFATISKGGINVNHKHLIEAGYLCVRCHATVAHGQAVPKGSQTYPTMDQCLICHNNQYRAADGTVAVSRCDLCHVQPGYGSTPASHKETDWLKVHGSQGILSTCSACHPSRSKVSVGGVQSDLQTSHLQSPVPGTPPNCISCHGGVVMPHDGTWLSEHGAAEQKTGQATCLLCHKSPTYCLGCHKVRLPHPSDWFGKHAVAAAQSEGTCFTCHAQENCQACHAAHQVGSPPAHAFLKGKVRQWAAPTPSPSASASTGP